jgi:hypothetical protein
MIICEKWYEPLDFPFRPYKDYKVGWKETWAKLTKPKRPQNSEYFSPQCNYSVSTRTNSELNKAKAIPSSSKCMYHPSTVVIKSSNTFITYSAVLCPGWSAYKWLTNHFKIWNKGNRHDEHLKEKGSYYPRMLTKLKGLLRNQFYLLHMCRITHFNSFVKVYSCT